MKELPQQDKLRNYLKDSINEDLIYSLMFAVLGVIGFNSAFVEDRDWLINMGAFCFGSAGGVTYRLLENQRIIKTVFDPVATSTYFKSSIRQDWIACAVFGGIGSINLTISCIMYSFSPPMPVTAHPLFFVGISSGLLIRVIRNQRFS